jgi:hypothetical protein
MVTTHFHGELGNNIFQLAALLTYKDVMQKEYEIVRHRESWVASFRPLEIENLFEYKFNINDTYKNVYKEYTHNDCINQNSASYNFSYVEVPSMDAVCMRGYFQSEKYFLPIKDKLINEYFSPKYDVVKYIIEKYGYLLNNSLAIHFRAGGDRPNCYGLYPLLSNSYYEKAIEIVMKNRHIENFLVFSDNIELAKQLFGNRFTFIEGESNITDLIFMSMCSHNIIGNSTFSWWSAYLNKNKEKIVIAPETQWFGGDLLKLDKKDLFPKNWILL